MRAFSKVYQSGIGMNDDMKNNSKFPNHKEFFNDAYYEQEGDQNPFTKNAPGPHTRGNDWVDPNEPFIQENEFAPGGILASYKKRLGLTPSDIME